MKKRAAVITARGQSKRIPRKNIKEFCGKPILAYSIESALKAGIFDEVMVSTDDEEIADIALKYGAAVPFMRSEEAADDFATTTDVLLEVLDSYKETGREFDELCCIYPTAPFVTAARLKEAMQKLEETQADSVFTVVPFSFPPQRGLVFKDGRIQFQYPEYAQKRSQDLDVIYHDAGQFYCVNVEAFLRNRVLIMKEAVPVILPELEAQDIDNESDWKLAELKYKLFRQVQTHGMPGDITDI